MLVLPHGAIKRLVGTGSVDVWSPQDMPEPALNVHHVVRRKALGESITRAQAIVVRMTILQQLTTQEAWAAGFKNCDEFYEWWRAKYLTGPRMEEIECWCATYQREDLDIPQFLSRPVPRRSGDYTTGTARAIDDLEAVDAGEWAAQEDLRRRMDIHQEKWLWRQRRRKAA